MSYLRGSANYVWSTTCVLGKGATGAVYQGVNKQSGEPVAVKTFNQMSQMRPLEIQMREFEVLKKVNHENIVHLVAVEEDVESHSKVLVMELCTGGSLFTILDDPANSYGLEEEEFLIVLKDLSAGMKHLRDKDIIHRDLKPGNIMKYVAEDGRSVYKLTDFGAARELQDDQQFQSLYGTEEYLHPYMYERAVLKKSVGQTFKATVDLWSIGVTLYHVATGSLPFRPYGGRRNRNTMYFITTKKESGVISGVQGIDNGDIEWSRELPKTCLLSQGLRDKIVPLLGGLLECDERKMWSFEQFFDAVTAILHCKVFHVFFVNEGKELNVYLSPQATFQSLKDELAMQTGVAPDSQLLLHEKKLLDPGNTTLASELPATSRALPYFLFSLDTRDVKVQTGTAAHATRFPAFPKSGVSLEHDASLAKTSCSIAHATQRLVEKLCRCHSALCMAPLSLVSVQEERIKVQIEKLRQMKQTITFLDRQLQLLTNCDKNLSDLVSLIQPTMQDLSLSAISAALSGKQESCATLTRSLTVAEKEVEKLDLLVVRSQSLRRKWEQKCAECGNLKGCTETVCTYVQKIRDSWQALARDKVARTLSYHDEQFHILEKNKIWQTGQKLLSLLQDRCLHACHQLAQRLQGWNEDCYDVMKQHSRTEAELESCSGMVASYASSLETVEKEFVSVSTRCVTKLKSEHEVPASEQGFGDKSDIANAAASPINGEVTNSPFKLLNKKRTVPRHLITELQQLKEQQSEIVKLFEGNHAMLARFVGFSSLPPELEK
uniref:Putative tank binding protein kinase tbk1 n=1 Tax=Ornithodoros turicata TaxID=34597 RepID=A0A2R5L7V1_9ACAR